MDAAVGWSAIYIIIVIISLMLVHPPCGRPPDLIRQKF